MFSSVLFLASLLTEPSQCESIAQLTLPNTSIASARWMDAGPMTTSPASGDTVAGGGAVQAPNTPATMLPAHCRVAIVMRPSSDSHIEAEVWLPAKWNGKLQAVGNGGWAGVINYRAMAHAVQEGYATASTDAGHKGGSSAFAIGHPEKLIDFGYRAVHEMTVQSKAIVNAYYQHAARLSYWNGCSTGGRQGLMAAQRYPDDFDAILAGAPANNHSRLFIARVAVSVPTLRDATAAVPLAKLALVTRAVLEACDGRDGVQDGFLNDPRACSFDIARLQCTSGDAASCLTAPQIETMKRAYAPLKRANGEPEFPGMEPGSDLTWRMVSGSAEPVSLTALQIAHGDPAWDPKSFDLERDLALVIEKVGFATNSIDPDLRAFKARGGKLLLYHGWNDGVISAGNSINYYEQVLKTMGPGQDDWLRLFMVPGMDHCPYWGANPGGVGPDQVNWMAALERWGESGKAPDRIEAARVVNNRIDMTRPVCAYPQIAKHTGIGSTNDAQNFVCVAK
jgi:feruloyl esterase